MEAVYYSQNPRFYVAVDCIIFCFEDGVLKVLLQQRDFEPFRGEHTLMGGFVQENEDVTQAAQRILEERTGILYVPLEQVGAFGSPNRDPGARVVSIAYMALVVKHLCNDSLNAKHNGFWVNVYDLPSLSFGHDEMVHKALARLRIQIGKTPVGFQLLPPMFTLSQLQHIHEAILNEHIDKRNFRKRVADMSYIEKTDKIEKTNRKRGAALYRYNQLEYEKSLKAKL